MFNEIDKIFNILNNFGLQAPVGTHCRGCKKWYKPSLTPFQAAWAEDPGQRRWRYYPDLTKNMSSQELRKLMQELVFSSLLLNLLISFYFIPLSINISKYNKASYTRGIEIQFLFVCQPLVRASL